MNNDERKALSEQLLSNPLLKQILKEMKADAVDDCINAQPLDHDTRTASAMLARVIIEFQSKLESNISNNSVDRQGIA